MTKYILLCMVLLTGCATHQRKWDYSPDGPIIIEADAEGISRACGQINIDDRGRFIANDRTPHACYKPVENEIWFVAGRTDVLIHELCHYFKIPAADCAARYRY